MVQKCPEKFIGIVGRLEVGDMAGPRAGAGAGAGVGHHHETIEQIGVILDLALALIGLYHL